jgi:formate-dependent nitrite reductase membrane component NrfD
VFRQAFTIAGTLAGFFLASYTGVLLSVTNRAIWADTNFIGLLFLVSAASTSAALLLIVSPRSRAVTEQSLRWLRRMDRWVMALELLVIVAFLLSLGAVAQAWLNGWGLMFVVGFGVLGVALPLLLHMRPAWLGRATIPVAAVLAIAGGFIMRAVVVLSAQTF